MVDTRYLVWHAEIMQLSHKNQVRSLQNIQVHKDSEKYTNTAKRKSFTW